ncbi:MAG: ABC transporter ATP-binding protein [Deinococcales bacterium]
MTTIINPASAKTLVHARGVDKQYANGTVAIQGVNLEVKENEFVSLVGPSGCGKSTLLRIIAGLGDATAGEVRVDGRQPNDLQARGRSSFVFQEATLLPWRTVRQNVELPLELMRVPKASWDAVVSEALETVGLSDFKTAFPRELSGGMKMRVSIARALVTKPRLLLMDEPFGALDEITRQKLNDDLMRVRELTKATIIFVTHNVFEAVFLSSRIVVMSVRPGRILDELELNTPYPRVSEHRGTPEFARGVNSVMKLLAYTH